MQNQTIGQRINSKFPIFTSIVDGTHANFWNPSLAKYRMGGTISHGTFVRDLVSNQIAIANFAKILTGRDIKVEYKTEKRGTASTDGKSITISSELDPNTYDSVVGLCLHEASHIMITDFEMFMFNEHFINLEEKEIDHREFSSKVIDICVKNKSPYSQMWSIIVASIWKWHKQDLNFPTTSKEADAILNNISKKEDLVDLGKQVRKFYMAIHAIHNSVEDRRIDSWQFSRIPGYQNYYISLYQRFFGDVSTEKEDAQALSNVNNDPSAIQSWIYNIIIAHSPAFDETQIDGLEEIYNIIDIENIDRLSSGNTKEDNYKTLEVVKNILWVILKNIPTSDPDSGQEYADSAAMRMAGESGSMQKLDLSGLSEEQIEMLEKILSFGEGSYDGEKAELDSRTAASVSAMVEVSAQMVDVNEGDQSGKKSGKAKNSSESKSKNITDSSDSQEQKNRSASIASPKDVCYYIYGHDKKTLKSDIASSMYSERRTTYLKNVTDGVIIGKSLGRKLKTRDEEVTQVTTRLKSGKVNSRVLSEIPTGTKTLFKKTDIQVGDQIYLHISLDASGSMSGSPWASTIQSAVAIAKAASMISSIHCQISLRGVYNGSAAVWVAYDSEKISIETFARNIAPHLYPGAGGTPEGLCYEALMKDILKFSRGKKSYFINLSDGAPNMGHFNGQREVLEYTKRQVDVMRRNGINILSFLIDEYGYGSSDFQSMYGKDGVTIDVKSVAALAKTINKMLQRDVTVA